MFCMKSINYFSLNADFLIVNEFCFAHTSAGFGRFGSVGNAERDVDYWAPENIWAANPVLFSCVQRDGRFSVALGIEKRGDKQREGKGRAVHVFSAAGHTCVCMHELAEPDGTLLCGVLTTASSTGERHVPPSSMLLSPRLLCVYNVCMCVCMCVCGCVFTAVSHRISR